MCDELGNYDRERTRYTKLLYQASRLEKILKVVSEHRYRKLARMMGGGMMVMAPVSNDRIITFEGTENSAFVKLKYLLQLKC